MCNVVAKDPDQAPIWLKIGRTNLSHKKGPTNVAKNQRPIMCLPNIIKFMTLMLTDQIYEHVTANFKLPFEKKGVEDDHVDAKVVFC